MTTKQKEIISLVIIILVTVAMLVWSWRNPKKMKRYWSEEEIRALK